MLTFELKEGERDMAPTHSFFTHEHQGPPGALPDLETNLDCRIWDTQNSEMNAAHSSITLRVPARFILADGA